MRIRKKVGKAGRYRVSFLVLFSLVLSSSHGALSAAVARPSRTLVLAIPGEPKSFNELVAQETSTTQITGFLFEGLTRLNTETGETEGRLAERWEVSPDGLRWTFHLRRDVLWFDGTPFTTRDVLFTFNDLIYNPEIINAARDIFTVGGKHILVEPSDPYTVTFLLPSPFAPFLMAMGQSIYPEHVLKPAVTAERFSSAWGVDSDPAQIIGTGPFRIAKYLPGERVELVRNERYWQRDGEGRRLPYMQRIIFLIIPNPDLRLLKFLEGETDFHGLSGVDYPLLAPKMREKKFSLYDVGAQLGSNFLAFNQGCPDARKRSWFRSRIFRRAVAHSLDRPAMIDVLYGRMGVAQCSPLSPSTPFFFNRRISCYEYDPGRSISQLRGDGFIDSNADGWLEDKEGNPVELVLLTNAENPERVQMAGMIREDLARIGIKAHLLTVEFNSLVTKLVATHDWDAVLLGLTGEIDPHFGANVWLSSGSLHFWNAGAPEKISPWEGRIDEIFAKALGSLDRSARRDLYGEWQEIAARELPVIYTVLPRLTYAVRNRFTNLRPTVLGGPFHNIEWIDIRDV